MTNHYLREKLNNEMNNKLRPQYDFAQMKEDIRGKYVERYQAGTNLKLLAPNVAQAFPSAE